MSYVDLGAVLPSAVRSMSTTKTRSSVKDTKKASVVTCKTYGLDTFYRFIRSLDNQLVFQRAQVNGNRPTKYKFFFGHGKTVLKDERAAKVHMAAIRYALKTAEARKILPRPIGPYFIPFGLPEQLKDPAIRAKITNLQEVEDFFYRISAMSLLKTDKTFFENILKQRGNQLTIAGWPEYPFGWVGSQLGFETGDWQKLAKAYYDALIELAKRTCTYAPPKPKPITDVGREFGAWFQREIINKNRATIQTALALAPKDVRDGILSGNAFQFLWDSMSGFENLFVTVIERVRIRSGKNERSLMRIGQPPVIVDMRASYGQSFLKTLAQTLTLMGTEIFATNDELIRDLFGMERGQRGFLGEPVTATVAAGTATAAVPAAQGTAAVTSAWTAAEITAVVLGVLGVLAKIVGDLLAADVESKKAEAGAEKAKAEAEAARFSAQRQPSFTDVGSQESSSLLLPGLAVAGLAAYLLFFKRGNK